jgi:hypothetical protein
MEFFTVNSNFWDDKISVDSWKELEQQRKNSLKKRYTENTFINYALDRGLDYDDLNIHYPHVFGITFKECFGKDMNESDQRKLARNKRLSKERQELRRTQSLLEDTREELLENDFVFAINH